jgi:hypothetical protein
MITRRGLLGLSAALVAGPAVGRNAHAQPASPPSAPDSFMSLTSMVDQVMPITVDERRAAGAELFTPQSASLEDPFGA